MNLTDSESKILLKIYDMCFISLNDEFKLSHFYNLMSKNHLWNSIKSLEKKDLIFSSRADGLKYVGLTGRGKSVVKGLVIIRDALNN